MKIIEKLWYQDSNYAKLLLPLSWLYCFLVTLRRWLYLLRILPSKRVPVPVIVVGNISVGGTGKTPLVVWLAAKLKEQGYKPGIISRGYKGKARSWPQQVRPDSDPVIVGDEPVLIARRSHCPMAVGPDRVETARQLIQYNECDVIISDDGMQHYHLRRDIEIAVVDSKRGFGNGYCLPAGPLREMKSRLKRVSFVVSNNQNKPSGENISMYLDGDLVVNLKDKKKTMKLSDLKGKEIKALAGIGNPERFFEMLRNQGCQVSGHAYSDHHLYKAQDLIFTENDFVLMTEKDAVKIERFAQDNYWYIPVEAKVQKGFRESVISLLKVKTNAK
jgi:tetraacyldisaccharide 4'-kinase